MKRLHRNSAWFLCVAALLSACARDGARGTARTAAPVAETDVGPRALCAARTPGGSGVDRALATERGAALKNPDLADGWLALGATWVQKARESGDPGFYLNADACADAALLVSPGNRIAENLRGLSHLNAHRFRDARDLATKILGAYDDDPAAWGTLSDAELELGDVDAAEKAAQRMLDLKPGLASYGRAAYLRWLRGDTKAAKVLSAEAIRAGREAKDREPLAWTLVQAALVFWNEGDYRGALSGFELALTEAPDYPPALVGKGRVALAEGRYADAVAALAAAYAKTPLVETAWLLGDAKRLSGDHAGAEQAYAAVVTEGRAHDARTLSLFLSSRARDPEEAVRLARSEMRERPGPYTKDALAWALYRRGELAEARRLSDEVVGLGVSDARVLFHAGAIRLAAGDATGKKLVERALSANSAFDVTEAEEARRLVAKT